MLSLSKYSLFILLVTGTAHAELKPNQTAALDQFISERARAPQMTPALVAQLTTGVNSRLEALENKILPIAIVLGRAMNDLNRLMGDLDRRIVEIDTGKMSVNPYDDKGWVQITKSDMHKVCCEMKKGIGLEKHGFSAPRQNAPLNRGNLGGSPRGAPSASPMVAPAPAPAPSYQQQNQPFFKRPPQQKRNKANKGRRGGG